MFLLCFIVLFFNLIKITQLQFEYIMFYDICHISCKNHVFMLSCFYCFIVLFFNLIKITQLQFDWD